MEFEVKFKSVAWKWILNVFLVMLLVVVVLTVLFCIFIRTYYINKAQGIAEEYGRAFVTPLANCSQSEFQNTARQYCEEFLHKDKLEVQILDSRGNVLFSTTGFLPENNFKPDYDLAVANGDSAYWTGKSAVGENILAETVILDSGDKPSNGAVRWIISLTRVNRHILIASIAAVVIGLIILTITGVSGLYFIKSIVNPIRDVSNISRKIAMGDFNSRIDISANNEVGELCDSINYMASELQSAENMKNEFISSVSHELRTPLTAIRGWAETAKMSIGYDEETVKKGLDVVLSESERLRSLVEELLDFSRMQSGRLSLNVEAFDLRKVIRESAEMYDELAKKQGVELLYIPLPNQVVCKGDFNRIKQVFINVIDNALKYNQPGGQILITTTMEEGCVQVSISDTGVGIAVADLDRVKEKFYKANKTVRGSGIGLAVADEIMKQHNGLLLIDSIEGIGTTVTVVFPIYDEEIDSKGDLDEL